METTIVYGGYTGAMEKSMESTIVYGGYIQQKFFTDLPMQCYASSKNHAR